MTLLLSIRPRGGVVPIGSHERDPLTVTRAGCVIRTQPARVFFDRAEPRFGGLWCLPVAREIRSITNLQRTSCLPAGKVPHSPCRAG